MELSDAKRIVNITGEERKSIGNYLTYRHTAINMLADFNPENYEFLKNKGWYLPESLEDVKKDIEDFVNVYSAMYKNAKHHNLSDSIGYRESKNLIRGTSVTRMKNLEGTSNQFLSMSTDELIAKRFCEYGDSALVQVNVSSGVPFLNAEEYRGEYSDNEKEIIVAPFTRISRKQDLGKKGDYNYYSINIDNPGIRPIPNEEVENLGEDIYSNFEQQIIDIKEFLNQSYKSESLSRQLARAKAPEDIKYIQEDIEKNSKLVEELRSKTSNYAEKLQKYLQGRCAQKIKEISEATKMVEQAKKEAEERAKQEAIARKEAEQKRLEEERIAREKAEIEERRKSSITELGKKLNNEPVESNRITYKINDTYNQMLYNERNMQQIARSLGINFQPQTRVNLLDNIIEDITFNITDIEKNLEGVTVQEDMSQEEIDEKTEKYSPYLDGISYASQILQGNPDFAQIHTNQMEYELKRSLYLKANQVIKNAKLGKLNSERETIQTEKVGFFGKLLGKDELKDEKLKNIDLKAEAIMTEIPEEKERYSVKDILADLYACAITEFDGNFTPEMLNLYNNITNTFGSKGQNGQLKSFSQEHILKLAQAKINTEPGRNLLAVAGNGTKRLSKIERLRAENGGLQQQIATNKMKNGSLRYSPNRGNDAVRMFSEKLNGVRAATKELLEPRTREDMQKTFDLWGDPDK
jgi:hypothetical protein